MANEAKQYFLAPSWDYPPGGPIALGNIIVSPLRPVPPLIAADDRSDVPEGLISSIKRGVEWVRESTRAQSLSIWTKFIEIIGLDVGLDVSSDKGDIFRFERMTTEEFFPNKTSVCAALQASATAMRLLVNQHKSLYVIVGVKTVHGAVVKRSRARARGGVLDLSVDMAMTGAPVPVSVGPSIEASSGRTESVSFEGSDDFVFAFRVQRLRVTRTAGELKQENYNKGALLGRGTDAEEDPLEHIELVELDTDHTDTMDFNRIIVREDTEDVDLFVAKT